ncbi:hypothetical protein Ddye_011435 [Dipteronia dyeriana]|uniref:Protein kinase domain-containing protein n=1 Tax=Dipteronia dyeriana TaxID=168575 RepID=A0AAE0CGX8_9ROSI|nr:hypothetical protein Ddye_011435 [Dipteronia dyeriana]
MVLEILRHWIFAFLGLALSTVLQVHAQNQKGFISLDCGTPRDSIYTERITNIEYISDATFTDTGVDYNISSEYNSVTLEQPFLNVRSFPEGTRNCYTLKPARGNTEKLLIRASFMYGNYDGQNIPPSFDLLLDSDEWDSVQFNDASTIVTKEILHVPKKNYLDVCLVNTGSGTPFISALELRPLKNDTYPTDQGLSLLLYSRLDVGSKADDNEPFRQVKLDDAYDRIWSPYTKSNWVTISSSFDVDNSPLNSYQPPSTVMQTAAMPENGSNSLVIDWEPSDPSSEYFAYLYFAELDQSQSDNTTREEMVFFNGKSWYGPFTPYLSSSTIYSTYSLSGQRLEFSFNKTKKSPLPPLVNALELYQLKKFQQLLTNQQDVDAIKNIKTKYGVKKNWQGDPCAPVNYLWHGLNCSHGLESNTPKIISLDLSNNSLTGQVPDFLLQLSSLTVLNLRGNNLKGSVPVGLMEKQKTGSFSLSLEGNPNLCLSGSCTNKKAYIIKVHVVASVVAFLVLLIAICTTVWIFKRGKQDGKQATQSNGTSGSFELKNRRFSYSDVVRMTNNFETIIGKGGFGTVYYGCLDNTQVAVKMLSPSSIQGYKEFQAEVELLMRVHHKNLTSLVGYCDDGTNMGLIYEFMANGNLETHLSDKKVADILSWEKRLQIATEAALGLEYLHSGCKPPIVHRDVKSTNILLNEKFQAKLADFGLSRIFPTESGTHMLASIAGTPGYLDPEYYISSRLTEKSDVYSFGVVLLELITSKTVIEKSNARTHISQWVSLMLAKADIKNVVDPRLHGDFDINSVWKAVEIAMACVFRNSAKRPTMTQVVMELNECLAIEIARGEMDDDTNLKDSVELINFNYLHSELSPLARFFFPYFSVSLHLSGFISLDCGTPRDSIYTERITNIEYISDATFTDTGVDYNISSEYNSVTLEQPFLNVRSFPEGTRNCYTLKPARGNTEKLLIRASFMYGNYDGQNIPPSFDLLLDSDEWDSVQFNDASTIVTKEILHVPKKNYLDVCLVNTGSGTPFISALELRPLKNDTYPTDQGLSLLLYSRLDVGSKADDNEPFRQVKLDDAYDRIWSPYTKSNWVTISSSFDVDNSPLNSYQPPSTVMQTAAMPENGSNSLVIDWEPSDPSSEYFAYLYFAELDQSQSDNTTREEMVFFNGKSWYGPFTPYLSSSTIYSTYSLSGQRLEFSFNKTKKSPLPPLVNALELYQLKKFQQLLTNQQDVDAIKNIKTKYGVKKNWQGDPCAPVNYLWHGLNCSHGLESNTPKIISLNLSSSGLSGDISPFISDLRSLQYLDLSNNSLTGQVPDFLLQLSSLTVLNLRGNNLKGSVPVGLMEKQKTGSFSLSLEGNPNLCLSGSCTNKKAYIIKVHVVASVVAFLVLLIAICTTVWIFKRGKQDGKQATQSNGTSGSFELKNRRFSYSDVVRMTNNFETIIGKGGFGTVYYGCLDNTQVAVKMLSPSSIQGYKEFQAEVELLMRVHHKNLTSLVGYCDDGTNMGLIYEFMANGNLETHLSDKKVADILSWEKRLQIATEAALGLEYLHSGCKPPIVHRDVKSTNILLNEKFQAKLADFGLSRIFPTESGTHMLASIAGTPGYLDPEYYISSRLTEKSDVYSFGVVLLELITSKTVIEKSNARTHISQWVSLMLAKADIKNVVDPRLHGDFDINSVWKAVEIAMACVFRNSAKRPTMTQVVMELNECLAIEIARGEMDDDTNLKDSVELINFNYLHSELSPLAR